MPSFAWAMVLGIILFLASGALGSLTSNKPRQASQTALVLKFQHVSSCSAKIPFLQPYTIQECQNLRITLIINQNHLFWWTVALVNAQSKEFSWTKYLKNCKEHLRCIDLEGCACEPKSLLCVVSVLLNKWLAWLTLSAITNHECNWCNHKLNVQPFCRQSFHSFSDCTLEEGPGQPEQSMVVFATCVLMSKLGFTVITSIHCCCCYFNLLLLHKLCPFFASLCRAQGIFIWQSIALMWNQKNSPLQSPNNMFKPTVLTLLTNSTPSWGSNWPQAWTWAFTAEATWKAGKVSGQAGVRAQEERRHCARCSGYGANFKLAWWKPKRDLRKWGEDWRKQNQIWAQQRRSCLYARVKWVVLHQRTAIWRVSWKRRRRRDWHKVQSKTQLMVNGECCF